MKHLKTIVWASALLATLSGCANMSAREKNAAIGAAVGGVAGSILTDQSTLGTLGGAALGGYLGHQVRH